MDKFQICEVTEDLNHAGSKAPKDVSEIANKMGFKKLLLVKSTNKQDAFSKINRQIVFYKEWKQIYNRITNNSIVLLQHPFRDRQLTRNNILLKLKKKKSVKFICIVHDVEELRKTLYDNYYKKEFEFMLTIADKLIIHNTSMAKFFMSKKVPSDKLINLEIFDYLKPYDNLIKLKFSKNIVIAGNLDSNKSSYLKELNKINVRFTLYGPNFSLQEFKNIDYKGSYPANKIPQLLNSGFGLIWDGESILKCSGPTGNYLKYNDPHKLSLYLASGLPVIIWNKAAESKFVKQNKVGFTVSALTDIPEKLDKVSLEDYTLYCNNARKLAKQLSNGFFTERAIEKAVNTLK